MSDESPAPGPPAEPAAAGNAPPRSAEAAARHAEAVRVRFAERGGALGELQDARAAALSERISRFVAPTGTGRADPRWRPACATRPPRGARAESLRTEPRPFARARPCRHRPASSLRGERA